MPPKRRFIRRKKKIYKKRRGRITASTTKINPYRRLSGVSKMQKLTLSRCFEMTDLELKVSNHVQAGFWAETLSIKFTDLPNYTTMRDMYRFFRIKKVIIQYTPATRSDEYSKMFAWPATTHTTRSDGLTQSTPTQLLYNAHGACLEIKQINYVGYATSPANWDSTLNMAGKLRKCATTSPFKRLIYPKIQQIVQDYAVNPDPSKLVNAPWLSTDIGNNLDIPHLGGVDCFHSMNNVSYDNSKPLNIHRRCVVQIELKGLKF